MLFLPEPVLLLQLSDHLLQLRPPVLHHLQVLVGITRNMGIKLRTVENPVQSRKTSSLAGGASLPTCWFLRVVF